MSTEPAHSSGRLHYGGAASDHSLDQALENFTDAAIQPLSFCCTPIELLSNDGNDTIISSASAFFWKSDNIPYLVTNWHVVSGRNPFTGSLVSSNAFVPRKIRFYGVRLKQEGLHLRFERIPWVLTLNEDAQHILEQPPQLSGGPVDLWATPIAEESVIHLDAERRGFRGAEGLSCFVNEVVRDKIVTRAGDDCLILGYPLANYEGLMPPVWKRGSIASDTNIAVDGRPIFLVDAATSSSMSGSPILRRVVTHVAQHDGLGALVEFARFECIGVYAGRLESRELERTNIGYGWYRTLIDQVIKYYGYGPHSLARVSAGNVLDPGEVA